MRLPLLYVVSVLGGAAGALLLDPNAFTGGASGGVFGLAAAATLAVARARASGSAQTTWGPLIVINFLLGFFVSDVSIGGHIGGSSPACSRPKRCCRRRGRDSAGSGYAGVVLVGVAAISVALWAAAR